MTINQQRIYTNIYIRSEMKDMRSIHLIKMERKEDRMKAIFCS